MATEPQTRELIAGGAEFTARGMMRGTAANEPSPGLQPSSALAYEIHEAPTVTIAPAAAGRKTLSRVIASSFAEIDYECGGTKSICGFKCGSTGHDEEVVQDAPGWNTCGTILLAC